MKLNANGKNFYVYFKRQLFQVTEGIGDSNKNTICVLRDSPHGKPFTGLSIWDWHDDENVELGKRMALKRAIRAYVDTGIRKVAHDNQDLPMASEKIMNKLLYLASLEKTIYRAYREEVKRLEQAQEDNPATPAS